MKRLTHFIGIINEEKTYTTEYNQRAPGGKKQDIVNRLGLYEDEIPIERISEATALLQAKDKGLLVILPEGQVKRNPGK